MAERSQHSNILLAFISLTAVIVIVSLIGFFTLGKGPEIIQGQAEADEYRVSSKVPGRILEFRVIFIHLSIAKIVYLKKNEVSKSYEPDDKKVHTSKIVLLIAIF